MEDRDAILEVLTSNMIGQGVRCSMLELRLAHWVGAEDGVAVGSGSAAIVLALHGLGVLPGDEVILPTYICRSVFEAVLVLQGKPVLCDVGDDWMVTADTVARKMTSRTRAIVVPHMYGIFCDVAAVRSLGIPVVEDCAQAVAEEMRHEVQGDVAVFSFHPTKCLTAGEGGVAVSKDIQVVDRMRAYRDGKPSELQARMFSPMSDIAAALAISQLDQYSGMLARRQSLASRYRTVLENICPMSLNRRALERSMFFRFPVVVDRGIKSCHDDFLKRGIQVRQGVDALLHRHTRLDDTQFPVSVGLFDTTVSLPIYPALTVDEESRCLKSVADIFSNFN